MQNKTIGNQYENNSAKKISNWLFQDEISIIRSTTSGALKDEKAKYNGDLIPVGDKVYKKFNTFPFLFECKKGYKDKIPTFVNYGILADWIKKCEKEKTNEQKIIFILFKSGRNPEIVITNTKMQIRDFLNFDLNGKRYYVYYLKYVLNNNINILYEESISVDFLKEIN